MHGTLVSEARQSSQGLATRRPQKACLLFNRASPIIPDHTRSSPTAIQVPVRRLAPRASPETPSPLHSPITRAVKLSFAAATTPHSTPTSPRKSPETILLVSKPPVHPSFMALLCHIYWISSSATCRLRRDVHLVA